MLRILGAMLIAAAPVLLSLSQYRQYFREERLISAFSETLAFCTRRIQSELASLPDLAVYLCENGPLPLCGFWQGIAEELKSGAEEFERIWSRAIYGVGLEGNAAMTLLAFPAALRSYDTECICDALQRLAEQLEEERSIKRERFYRDFKIHTGVRVCAGVLLLILLF